MPALSAKKLQLCLCYENAPPYQGIRHLDIALKIYYCLSSFLILKLFVFLLQAQVQQTVEYHLLAVVLMG